MTTRYRRNPEVLWRSTSAGPLVLRPGVDEVEQLTGSAAAVWEVLDGAATSDGVATSVRELAGEGLAVDRVLDDMVRLGLVLAE